MKIGEIILNQYRIDKKLGEGGFGAVYQARHLSWNVDLAIKVPKPEIVARTGGVEAFEQEAETWVNLGLHPHTVSCYYVRRLDRNPLVFAEYVAGGSLHDWIRGRKLYEDGKEASLEKILDIAIQFAWGLDFSHEQGLIHQDVKPENVMMTPGGVVKVTDFGLAKGRVLVDAVKTLADGTVVTEAGAMTPAYCSPEQAGKQTLTRRTDLWSWAVSVLEMFVGERTWQSGSIAGYCLENYLQQEPEDSTLPQIPTQVAELLSHCFQENPSERPRTMVDVANRLQEIYQQVTGGIAYPRTIARAAEDIADSLNNRAVSLLDLGKQKEAMQLWEKALQVQPQHPESTYNQGLILWRGAEIDDLGLLRRLEEIKNSHPDDWQVDYLIGLVHLERDDCEKAIEILEKIGEEGKGQEEVKKALALAKERLPNSSRLLRIFEEHTYSVSSVCLSQDGRFALSGSQDETLKFWEVGTGQCLHTFEEQTDNVNSVCLSQDGRFAFSGSKDETLKLWSIETGQCLQTFEGHTDDVNSVCLSRDGCFALSGSHDQTIKLWSVETGKCLRIFEGYTGSAYSLCLSADERFALSGSRDQTLKLWSVETGKCLRTFEGHTDYVHSVCLSTDGRFALSGSDDQTIKLWSVETGKCLRTFEGHTAYVNSVCLSQDERFALSGSRDKTLKLWKVNCYTNSYFAPIILSQVIATETVLLGKLTYEQELKLAQKAIEQKDYVSAAQHISEARSQPGCKYRIEAFKIWTSLYVCLPRKPFLSSWKGFTFEGHTDYVHSVCLSADGRFALSGSSDKTLKLWSVETGKCLRTFEEDIDSVKPLCLSADGLFALSVSWKTLKLWSVETGRCLRTFEGHTNSVFSLCLSADGRFALSGSSDKTLKLWDVQTGKCLRTFEEHTDFVTVFSVCLSADGRFALSGSSDKTLKLWNVQTGKCLRTFEGHTDSVLSVCLSADGKLALSGSRDKTLKLWKISTSQKWWKFIKGKCLRTFEGHTDSVKSVCLSQDGRFAISRSNRIIKLWDVQTGKCLRTFEGDTDLVNSVCLSQDGSFVISGNYDKTLKLWFLDWDLELKQPADWDEGARPYLDIFIQQQTPYAATIPTDREPTEAEITLALTRRGTPTWTETDFNNLLYTLGCAGYGWLRPEGVRKQLEQYLPQKSTPMSQNPQSNKVILTIARGSLQGQQFTFSERTTCLIGRASDCNIQLPDDEAHSTISRYHCLLDINPPNLRIRDFGSKNGTYVNAKKIGQREDGQTPEEAAKLSFPEYDLKTDDLIQLGETVFLVTIEEAKVPANIYSLQSVPSTTIDIEALIKKANQGEKDLIAIQGYKIVQKLGKGGFGEVYLALNNQTGEMVALKVMLPKVAAIEEYVHKFIREIQLTQALNHPNIVRLRDFGHSNNTIFLTLEYCEGGSVWDLMQHKGGRLSVQEAIFVTLQVLDGLEYAHNAEIPFQLANGNTGKVNGIVHRDLKPSNLFLTKVDKSIMVKIGDYGLAKAFDLAGLSGLSATGSSAGTPAFIPRQQIVDFKYAKPDVDVWATAATLYNMLTGVFPRDFEGRDPFNAVLKQDAVPIHQRDPNIPKALAEVIDLALRDRPEIYFKSAADFRKALESVL